MRIYPEPEEKKLDQQGLPPGASATDVVFATAGIEGGDFLTSEPETLEIPDVPQLIPDEEVMGAVECATLSITVLNGVRYCLATTGMPGSLGMAYELAHKAGELLDQHLNSPEAIVNVIKNDQPA